MKKIILFVTLYFFVLAKLMAANILVLNLGDQPNSIQSTLESGGHTVHSLSYTGATGGAIATHLSSNTYDQIFLFDITSIAILDSTDIAAVAGFWNTNKGLVVDGRSYGYHFQGSNPSEQALLNNVANTFTLTGGGLWIGTDHDPGWTYNGNAVLNSIGANVVSGNHSLPVNLADPSSVLLQNVIPTDLWAAGQSVGAAPLGTQPNGIEMYLHFGNDTGGVITPYISASFPLSGPPTAAPRQQVPVPVNQPWALALLMLSLVGFARAGSRRKWLSDHR